ncbi:hypothetical protein, variant [Verruconis gallopava]|nr:hypothetical protein, variant [Verruconis gallopava]KIW03689.1 hypothetical protein, variant [Verruconis gallopava]
MIFHEHYLSKGEEGGRQAAEMLRQSTELYAREQVPDLPNEIKVVTRMYANVKGLADMCSRSGLVASPTLIEDFVRGFTRGNALFDFIDVGPGKDRADVKVSELFKLHAYDPRCKHIVFGCSHDNGFARLLEKYIFDEVITRRVTLLEGQPFGKELLDLPFNRSKFGTIFRSERIVPTPIGTMNGNPEVAAVGALLRSMSHTPSESISSMGESTYAKPSPVSWANRAAAAAAAVLPPPTPPIEKAIPEPTSKDTIPRNRKGQRLDPIVKFDRAEIDRVRKMKMCNVHYLRQECPYGNKCTHKHDKDPSKRELEVLKVVARFACCRSGSSCDDPRCIYGHRCQAPERLDPTKWPNERGKTCIFGPDCVFPAELHNIDIVPVKMTKV